MLISNTLGAEGFICASLTTWLASTTNVIYQEISQFAFWASVGGTITTLATGFATNSVTWNDGNSRLTHCTDFKAWADSATNLTSLASLGIWIQESSWQALNASIIYALSAAWSTGHTSSSIVYCSQLETCEAFKASWWGCWRAWRAVHWAELASTVNQSGSGSALNADGCIPWLAVNAEILITSEASPRVSC